MMGTERKKGDLFGLKPQRGGMLVVAKKYEIIVIAPEGRYVGRKEMEIQNPAEKPQRGDMLVENMQKCHQANGAIRLKVK